MTSKSLIALLSIAALAWVLPAGAQNLPIRIGASPASDHAAVFVGVEKGIFARHGLDAKVELYPTGVEMIVGALHPRHGGDDGAPCRQAGLYLRPRRDAGAPHPANHCGHHRVSSLI